MANVPAHPAANRSPGHRPAGPRHSIRPRASALGQVRLDAKHPPTSRPANAAHASRKRYRGQCAQPGLATRGFVHLGLAYKF